MSQNYNLQMYARTSIYIVFYNYCDMNNSNTWLSSMCTLLYIYRTWKKIYTKHNTT